MAKHAELKSSFWKDPKIKRLLKEEPLSVLLYLYYMSNPAINVIGIYEIDEDDDRVCIRYSVKRFQESKKILEKERLLQFEDNFVWVVGKGNFIKGWKQCAGAVKLLNELKKELKIKQGFIKKYEKTIIGYGYRIDRVSGFALTKTKTKTKKEKPPFSSSSENQNPNQKPKYEPGPHYCSGCKRLMADEGDKWFCPDCQTRKEKKLTYPKQT